MSTREQLVNNDTLFYPHVFLLEGSIVVLVTGSFLTIYSYRLHPELSAV